MVIYLCILMLGIVYDGAKAADNDSEDQKNLKELAQSALTLENAFAKLSLTLPSFPSGSEVSLGFLHHNTPRPESPVTLSELLKDTPRTPEEPAWRQDLHVTLINKTSFGVRVKMSNEALVTIQCETKPHICGDMQRVVMHATKNKLLKPNATIEFEIPIYEKLFGSDHVDSIPGF